MTRNHRQSKLESSFYLTNFPEKFNYFSSKNSYCKKYVNKMKNNFWRENSNFQNILNFHEIFPKSTLSFLVLKSYFFSLSLLNIIFLARKFKVFIDKLSVKLKLYDNFSKDCCPNSVNTSTLINYG